MIRKSLRIKLIISYLAVALLTVLVVTVFIRQTSGQQFLNLVTEQQASILREEAAYYFTKNGSFEGFFEYYTGLQPQLAESGKNQPPQISGPPGNFPRVIRGKHGLVDTSYNAIIPFLNYRIGQTVQAADLHNLIAVEVDGNTIAWIIPDTHFEFKLSAEEEVFLQRSNQAILLAALGGIIGAILMGILLAGFFLKPIRSLMVASRKMAGGELEQSVPVHSADELGQLSNTFNQMSADLAAADRQRRQLTADVTHDLSTPLQVISGYIEMLEDGETSLSPNQVQMIMSEIDLLRRLVNDLSMLSQADAKDLQMQMMPVEPGVLLERVFQAFEGMAAREGITLTCEIEEDLPMINVDEGRMVQVIGNLVENAMRYTPHDGQILLSANAEEGQVALCVADTGSGIAPQDLPYVFDRFYRADKARDGNTGKMGLGLAICKALVTAQGGMIHARPAADGQGTVMVVRFPKVS